VFCPLILNISKHKTTEARIRKFIFENNRVELPRAVFMNKFLFILRKFIIKSEVFYDKVYFTSKFKKLTNTIKKDNPVVAIVQQEKNSVF